MPNPPAPVEGGTIPSQPVPLPVQVPLPLPVPLPVPSPSPSLVFLPLTESEPELEPDPQPHPDPPPQTSPQSQPHPQPQPQHHQSQSQANQSAQSNQPDHQSELEPESKLLLAFACSVPPPANIRRNGSPPSISSPTPPPSNGDPNLDPFLASLQHFPPATTTNVSATATATATATSLAPSPLRLSPLSEPHLIFSPNFDHSTLDDHQLHSLLFPDQAPSPLAPTPNPSNLIASAPAVAFDPSIVGPSPSELNLTQLISPNSAPPNQLNSVSHDSLADSSLATAAPTSKPPKLPKAKLTQCNQLREAAEKALQAVWDTLGRDRLLDHDEDLSATATADQLVISRGLDRQFGELHALSAPFKPEDLALIWPQCMTNKSLKANYNSKPSPAYFGIKKANIAFAAEYILYAMPGEEAYGKNDIVYACEGFLPLVLDKGLVQDEKSWKLFNELKVQIYIQRLDQSGAEEANTRVLPNLFAETLSSYSGVQVDAEVEALFEAQAAATKAELVAANADLELLRQSHPYLLFAIGALRLLRKCQEILEVEQVDWQNALAIDVKSASLAVQPILPEEIPSLKRKRKRKSTGRALKQQTRHPPPMIEVDERRGVFEGLGDQMPQEQQMSENHGDPAYFEGDRPHQKTETEEDVRFSHDDISVHHNHFQQKEIDGDEQDGNGATKGRYNPYRLGRGKGPAAAPRRRWTEEEYELLLEEVRLHSNKYDCMAQIIKRHGKNGELSDTLRDQNNVSLKDKARNLTMEWSRHGYPEDKPWLKEAFARFAVKPRAPGQPHNGRRMGSDNEELLDKPLVLDPAVLLGTDLQVAETKAIDDSRMRLNLVEVMGEVVGQEGLQLDPELLGGPIPGDGLMMTKGIEGDVPVPFDPSLDK